jgi:UDP-glucose:(heptosyl)LPS alpha-1,3-glucosyltransferase
VNACLQRGHEIHIYTSYWEGEIPSGLYLNFIKPRGLLNHQKVSSFSHQLSEKLSKGRFDCVIGFNKVAGLDIYFAADVCYHQKIAQRSFWVKSLPRVRTYLRFEKHVFENEKTKILLLTEQQALEFGKWYPQASSRFYLLPPGIAKQFVYPENAAIIRQNMRNRLQLKEEEHLVLFVASHFKTKGLERALKSLALLASQLKQHIRFLIVGGDNATPYQRIVRRLGLEKYVTFFGASDDIKPLMLAADLLLHPSFYDSAGAVLLESLTMGLPVLTMENCGYGPYIKESQAGIVLPKDATVKMITRALSQALCKEQQAIWRQCALKFTKDRDLYEMPQRVVDIIEAKGPVSVL